MNGQLQDLWLKPGILDRKTAAEIAKEITRLVTEGYIVRSRADSGGEEADNNDTTRLEAALAVGAHSISTDYPGQVEGIDYWVEIPNGTPSRCNPISAPAWCSSEDIESLG